MNELAIPIVIMLLFVLAEALYLRWNRRLQVDWQDVMFNLNSGHLMLWLFRGLEVLCYGAVADQFSFALLEGVNSALLWTGAFFAWDLSFYWLHRLHHRYRLLWAIHVVHHQGEHFNLSLGVRNSWYSSLASIPFFIPLAIIGVPLDVFVMVSMIHYSFQFFNHCALTPRLGVLEEIFVTPGHHRVHHMKDITYSNRNFGGTFIIWDKLFGTFSSLPDVPYSYGVKGSMPSLNPFLASNIPLLQLFGLRIKKPEKKPAGPATDLGAFHASLLLFGLVIAYIHQYGYGYIGITWEQTVLFVMLVSGAVVLGRMSQQRAWGRTTWFLLCSGLPLVFLMYFRWRQIYWQIPMCIMAVHGAWLALMEHISPIRALNSREE